MSRDYFIVVVFFIDKVLGIIWSIGYLVLVYIQWMFDKYGVGFGVKLM